MIANGQMSPAGSLNVRFVIVAVPWVDSARKRSGHDKRRGQADDGNDNELAMHEFPLCSKCQRARLGPAEWLLPLSFSADDVAGVAAVRLKPRAASTGVICGCERTTVDVVEAGGEVEATDARERACTDATIGREGQ